MTRRRLAARIYEISHITGDFLLRSGRRSNEYFDKYRFESDPALLKEIAEAMVAMVPQGCDALAGLEMGGIPVATALSQATGVAAAFVRQKAKEYGTCRLAEGADVAGRRIVIVEDVVTSGGQIVESARELRALGAVIENVVCVIDRESGAAENLRKEGLVLRALFTMSELKQAIEP